MADGVSWVGWSGGIDYRSSSLILKLGRCTVVRWESCIRLNVS
jgi:hypothetical protein